MTGKELQDAGEITRLLLDWKTGDAGALNRLFPLVYEELRVLARRQLRRGGRDSPTLQTTALVHEAYVKLVDQTRADMRDRGHFFAVASKAMRHILVDHARARTAKKRGGTNVRVSLSDDDASMDSRAGEVIAVDEALEKLQALDPRLVQIVEMRFFGGLSVEETAQAMDLSERTVKRDWQKARAFLLLELSGGSP